MPEQSATLFLTLCHLAPLVIGMALLCPVPCVPACFHPGDSQATGRVGLVHLL